MVLGIFRIFLSTFDSYDIYSRVFTTIMSKTTVGVSLRMSPEDYQSIKNLTGKGQVGPFIRAAAVSAAKQIRETLEGEPTK